MKKFKSKKIILLALLLTSTFLFTGCGQQKSAQQKSGLAGKLSGLPFYYPADSSKINVQTITSPGNLDKRA